MQDAAAAPPTTFAFDNSYARLSDRFFLRQLPTTVAAPRLIAFNAPLATRLGLDAAALNGPLGAEIFSGNRVPDGADPIATAYAGHQFGHLTPQLGDGRAVLLGEIIAPDGARFDLQLKGAGPTPFSRRGDGRAALGPVLREYLVSEFMAALGIPTTRALAAVATGEPVYRETQLPGAVITRVAASHVRVGTFQYFAVRRDIDALRELVDYVIGRHYPEVAGADVPALALLHAVARRQAGLVARWMAIGFIHGVMNTDNCSIAGETIDYGPCAFMDTFDPATVLSSIDTQGRYAYANQPGIAQWNMARLAEALLPLLGEDQDAAVKSAEQALAAYAETFKASYAAAMGAKLGLGSSQPGDDALVDDLLALMAQGKADFTNTFRALSDGAGGERGASAQFEFEDGVDFASWAERWRARLAADPIDEAQRTAIMQRANPAYIPRNHRIEQAIVAAVQHDDFAPFERLHRLLGAPTAEQPDDRAYRAPPQPDEVVRATFCGT